jgi:membrane-associated phospholipid phosphatase
VATLVAAAALPLARKRFKIHPAAVTAAVGLAPAALAVLRPRTKGRDAALFALQMWAFTVVHELPYDDPERLRARLHIRYPIRVDRLIGLGEPPTLRLQRALARPGRSRALDTFLTFVHWAWFVEPHAALTWILATDERRFARSARQMAAVYNLGCAIYFLVPTAPPWWAGEQGYMGGEVRRMMVEVGERTWGRHWPAMYRSLGGNPWAAMPSLHFGTSLMAAILLAEGDRGRGAAGWAYVLTLGFALVYLGEHYVVDLAAGTAIVIAVRKGEPLVAPLAGRIGAGVQRLERIANG